LYGRRLFRFLGIGGDVDAWPNGKHGDLGGDLLVLLCCEEAHAEDVEGLLLLGQFVQEVLGQW